MKILQTISGLNDTSGGPSTCTYDLLKQLRNQGCDIELLTLAPNPKKKEMKMLGASEEWIKAVEFDGYTPFTISKHLKQYLVETNYDIYHTNGLWKYCNHITAKIAKKKNKVFVLSPHGMLYPAAIRRSYWKKRPLLYLFFEQEIMNADCIHVTCKQEMENVREFGYRGPIAIIPNPVVIPGNLDIKVNIKSKYEFGFLGRLHPVKNVPNLLEGIRLVLNKNPNLPIKMKLMGVGEPSYEIFLHNEVQRLRLNNVVEFCGFVKGNDKYKLLTEITALLVPSEFENFGMIVPEALCCGTPVMASLGTPWEELNTYHCGWWVDKSPQSIANVISEIIQMDVQDLSKMGQNGISLVKEKYDASHVASNMNLLYTWLIGKKNKPDFVYTY